MLERSRMGCGRTDLGYQRLQMNGAWVNRRRGRYFLGPYSDTREITIIGRPPYIVLREPCSADEVGRASRVALNASVDESVSADDAPALAERRVLELAHLAGVKDRATFERGHASSSLIK
jgi:hypothetical protein